MESIISNLVKQFENGAISRRDLIRNLLVVAAVGKTASAAEPQDTPFQSAKIDHISIQTRDMTRSIEFYEKIFGLTILGEDKANEIIRMGPAGARILVSLHHKPPTGIVDHYAIAIQGFNRDRVTASLKQHGLNAEQNVDYGFYVRDPEGIPVQIVGA